MTTASAPLSRTKRLFFIAILVLVPYLAVEAAASLYAWRTRSDLSVVFIEDARRTIAFDPVRGYRLNATPARMARFADGRLEYVGVLRGNAQGFGDRADFRPLRQKADGLRLAVFGDSFTHA